jgi:hypothetical protein
MPVDLANRAGPPATATTLAVTPPLVASIPAGGAAALASRAAIAALIGWMLFGSWSIADAIVEAHGNGWLAAATALAILASAFVSSIAGFAFCAIAGSALAYLKVEPVRAVQMMVLCSIATQCYAVWTIRESIRWRSLLPLIVAGATTVPLGVWLLLHVDAVTYAAGLGAFLTTYGCYIALRREARVVAGSAWRDAAAGALGGLAGGLAGVPGSFVTIWCSMRGWDKLQQRAIYQPYILAMQLVTIACLRWQASKQVGFDHDLIFVPFALLGAMAGLAVFRLMSNRQFQVAVSVLLVVSGLGLLGRVL